MYCKLSASHHNYLQSIVGSLSSNFSYRQKIYLENISIHKNLLEFKSTLGCNV